MTILPLSIFAYCSRRYNPFLLQPPSSRKSIPPVTAGEILLCRYDSTFFSFSVGTLHTSLLIRYVSLVVHVSVSDRYSLTTFSRVQPTLYLSVPPYPYVTLTLVYTYRSVPTSQLKICPEHSRVEPTTLLSPNTSSTLLFSSLSGILC